MTTQNAETEQSLPELTAADHARALRISTVTLEAVAVVLEREGDRRLALALRQLIDQELRDLEHERLAEQGAEEAREAERATI